MSARSPLRCNACGGPLSTRYEAVVDPQTRETFAIEACKDCGLGHTSPQPENLGPYYGAAYHGGRHGFTAAYCVWRRMRFLESVIAGTHGKLLDVGCGDGTFLLSARKAGWDVRGTEMNPVIAREAGLTVFEDVAEAEAQGPYRCITLWHSLEHIRDPKAMLSSLAAQLTPDGVLLVAVPDAEGIQARVFGAKWFHLDVPRHLFHFGDRSLTGLLGASGLDVFKRWHQEIELDLFGWTQSALNSVLPDPNVFFYKLTGRATPAGPGQVTASFVMGTALTAMAVPATAAGTLASRGGTLVFAARRPSRS